MLFNRQKILLGLLTELGGEVRSTDFQKLLFKFTMEEEKAPSYEFIPNRYGCFSRTSYADKRKLIDEGYLVNNESWVLARPFHVPNVIRQKVRRFAWRNRHLRGDSLVKDVYLRYPHIAWRSEILDRVIDDSTEIERIRSARPIPKGPGVATIGYEGRSQEAYLNALLADGITILCDVRKNPLSRKFGFSKKALASGCESIDIRYEHLPELGISREQRGELNTQADYDTLFETYEENSLPQQQESIEIIAKWVRSGERVALTCYELRPEQCHRHCVAEAVEHTLGLVDLVHL